MKKRELITNIYVDVMVWYGMERGASVRQSASARLRGEGEGEGGRRGKKERKEVSAYYNRRVWTSVNGLGRRSSVHATMTMTMTIEFDGDFTDVRTECTVRQSNPRQRKA